MASERQREANRRNGRNDGPRTETGKEHSRRNSLRHGLTSSTLVVLSEESQHEYEAVLRGFRESFHPDDAAEDALVLRLAHAHWRSLRSRRIETGILNIAAATERARAREIVEECPEHLDPHNAIAVAFMTRPPDQWHTFLRYDTTIGRDFFHTLDALMKLQRARQLRKPPPLLAAAAGAQIVQQDCQHEPQATSTPKSSVSDSGIRSVSQIAPYPEAQRTTNTYPAIETTSSSATNTTTKSHSPERPQTQKVAIARHRPIAGSFTGDKIVKLFGPANSTSQCSDTSS